MGSFIGGGNRSTHRKPLTYHKSLAGWECTQQNFVVCSIRYIYKLDIYLTLRLEIKTKYLYIEAIHQRLFTEQLYKDDMK